MRMSSAASVKSVRMTCFTPATYILYRQSCRETCSLAALRRAVASQPFDLQSEMPIPAGGVTPATSAYVSIRQHTSAYVIIRQEMPIPVGGVTPAEYSHK